MIEIIKCAKKPRVQYSENPKFGTVFAPHYLHMNVTLGQTRDFKAEIRPYGPEDIYPGMAALHYGQTIFEGMKAFAQPDGSAGIFRPELHATRFKLSARRMSMAEIPEEVFMEALKQYVNFEQESIPHELHHSLYLRPLLVASDNVIKVGASTNYTFYIMGTIAGNYFGSGGKIKPARVMVNRDFVRATPGGMGEAKTAANYAASIYPQKFASDYECDQVLFLDSVKHDNIDELGGMNFFAIQNGALVTPELNGCILKGVTRGSILELAKSLGIKTIEKAMSFTELMKSIESGETTELFACGTAAVISPIGELVYMEDSKSNPKVLKPKGNSELSLRLLDTYSKIQRGQEKAPGPWIYKV
ncbi:MAG: branched-chain amino acid aminotransferase [Bdellovibrionota bacterium]